MTQPNGKLATIQYQLTIGLCLLLTAAGCVGAPDADFGVVSDQPAFEFRDVGSVQQALVGGVWGFVLVAPDGTHKNGYSSRAAVPFSDNSVYTERLTTGHYGILFDSIGGDGGHAQVVVDGWTSSNRCALSGFIASGAHEYVEVNCTTFDGTPVDNAVWVQYVRGPGNNVGLAAYVALGAKLSVGVRHTPPANLSYNSRGGSNTITKKSTGVFSVDLPSMFETGRSPMIQVSTAGTTGEYCKILEDLRSGPNGYLVRVSCFNARGQAADAFFTLNTFVYSEVGINGGGAYGRALQANNTSWYGTMWSFDSRVEPCSSNEAVRARLVIPNPDLPGDPEVYYMEFGSMFHPGTVPHVTAQGADNVYCSPMQRYSSGNTQRLSTHCWTPAGTRARSMYYASTASYKAACPAL